MSLDLDAYLERIHYQGPLTPSSELLAELHRGHTSSIPFENLDVLLGREIRLDLESLQSKLVQQRRGGYCFEHNLLFAAVLERLGFHVDPLAARVRYRLSRVGARSHMLLLVEQAGRHWLCDVGFGAEGPILPIPMQLAVQARQFAWTYRLVAEAGHHVLQKLEQETWQDLYTFTLERQYLVDYEQASHYVSTHPSSIFTQTRTVQKATPEGRHALRNQEYTLDRGEQTETRTIPEADLLPLLQQTFGLHFPPETTLPLPYPAKDRHAHASSGGPPHSMIPQSPRPSDA